MTTLPLRIPCLCSSSSSAKTFPRLIRRTLDKSADEEEAEEAVVAALVAVAAVAAVSPKPSRIFSRRLRPDSQRETVTLGRGRKRGRERGRDGKEKGEGERKGRE